MSRAELRARPTQSQLQAQARMIVPRHGSDKNTLPAAPSIEELDYHGITMLALSVGTVSLDTHPQLNQRRAMMVANEALKKQALQELGLACSENGLRPLLFKGSALAYLVYPQPWLRPRTDSDVFVDQAELPKFEELFSQLGYQKLFAIEGDLVSYQATYSKALSDKVALNIDLHWRINNRQILSNSFSYSELSSRAQSIQELGFATLTPVDHLLVACLHRLGHHQREERLAWLYDMHLLAENLSPQEWQTLAERATDKQIAAITLDALMLCQSLFETAVEMSITDVLKLSAKQTEPSAIFLQRDLPEWRILRHELAALENTKLRLRWLYETLIPSPAYMRQQMQRDSLLLAHSERLWRGIKRIFRS